MYIKELEDEDRDTDRTAIDAFDVGRFAWHVKEFKLTMNVETNEIGFDMEDFYE